MRGEAWERTEPLPENEVNQRIRQGKERRKHLKKGVVRRIFGNMQSIVGAIMLTTATALAAASEGVPRFGSGRPDCLAVFGGKAMVSQSFSRWGWQSIEPVDVLYGRDMMNEDDRGELLSWIERCRPRLVIVSYPCRLWSSLTHLQYRTEQDKRRLHMKRKKELPLLELCEQVFSKCSCGLAGMP